LLCVCFARPGVCSFDIIIQGNEFFSRRKIKSFISFPKSFEGLKQRDILQWTANAQEDVTYEYEDKGFFNVQVGAAVHNDTSRGRDKWESVIIIQEGPRFTYGPTKLVTTDRSAPLISLYDLRTRAGREFDAEYPYRDKRDIERVYGDIGYAKRKVKFDYSFDDSLKTINVTFTIDPSYMIKFDSLIVRNRREKKSTFIQWNSNEKLIRKILKMNKGDTVRLSNTNSFKSKLKSTRLFNYIRLKDSLISEENKRSALILKLEERVPGRISSAVFYETIDGFGGEAGLSHKNILGRFYDAKAKVRLAQRRQRISLGLGNPLLFGSRWRLDNDMDLIWRQERLGMLSSFDALYSSSLSRRFSAWARFVGSVEFEGTTQRQEKIVAADTSLIKPRVINLNVIGAFEFSFLDNDFNPTRGTRFVFTFGNGGPFIDENNEFKLISLRHNWGEVKSSAFYPLAKWWISALRFDVGSFSHPGESNSRRFFLGGRNSIRNADYRSICPEKKLYEGKDEPECVPNSTPVYYLTSFEMRMGVLSGFQKGKSLVWNSIQQIQLVPFTDYGRIWEQSGKILPEGKGHDVGLGLRLPITVFNFRIDYAVGWDKGPDWNKWKIIIDLAQAF
jgi:outer membrane protein assembly factor BamA